MKKTFIFFIMLLFILATFGGCAKPAENISYEMRMEVFIKKDWPIIGKDNALEAAWFYVQDIDSSLSKDNNVLEVDTEGCPGISVDIRFLIVQRKGDWVGQYRNIIPYEEYSVFIPGYNYIDPNDLPEGDSTYTYFKYYSITDSEGNEKDEMLNHDLYDEYYSATLIRYSSRYQLQRKPGKHKLVFSHPAVEELEIEETTFTVIVNVKGDSRSDDIEIRAKDFDHYTYQKAGEYDMYILHNGISGGKAIFPEFGVFTKTTNEQVLDYMLPLEWNTETNPLIKIRSHKMDEYYKIITNERDINLI